MSVLTFFKNQRRVLVSDDSPLPTSFNGTSYDFIHRDPVVVGIASTAVVPARNRGLLVLQNDSDDVMYITTDGTPAALHKGMRLNGGGSTLVMDMIVPAGAINAIALVAGSTLLVTEV